LEVIPTNTIPLATAGEAVITGNTFDVSGCVFQINCPVVALIASSQPVFPGASAELYCVPMYTIPSTTAGLVRDTVPAARP
jgi:hypothetical protein